MRRTIIKALLAAVLSSFVFVPSIDTYTQQKDPSVMIYNKKLCEWPPRLKWKLYKKYMKWRLFKKWKHRHRRHQHRWRY